MLDLAGIAAYVSERNARAAAELLDAVEAACVLLVTHPGVGRVREDRAGHFELAGWVVRDLV